MEAWEAIGGDDRPALATTGWRAPTVEGLPGSRLEKRSERPGFRRSARICHAVALEQEILLRHQAVDDDVVARSAVEDVDAAAAEQHVVAGLAPQHVAAAAAD